MGSIRNDDADIHYEHALRPGAPALLLINALGTSLEMWDDQADALTERFELVRFDARGHGRSTSGTRNELTIEQLAQDALAVLDACGIARAHLCGLSLGGMTAMQIARQWPDRVLKVILSSTTPHMPPRETWQARIEQVRSQGMGAVAEATLTRWFTAQFRSAEPGRVDRVRQMLLATQPDGYTACCAAIRDMDLREDIKAIRATTLCIGGLKDPGTPPSAAELIATSIPGAQLKMLDAAHMLNIECAQEFTGALLEFLQPQ